MPHSGCQGLYPDPRQDTCQEGGAWEQDKTFGRAGDPDADLNCCGPVSSHLKDGLYEGNVTVEGKVVVEKDIHATEDIVTDANVVSSNGTCKGFDIVHPSKKEWRLRYICLEGPESAVFTRGRISGGSNIIHLPEYWRDLVEGESITVNLTPIGVNQSLFVQEIKWGNQVVIGNEGGSTIDCYYTVYGERKDGEKLIPEYEGTTPADYPGDSVQYSIAGYDYDVKKPKKES